MTETPAQIAARLGMPLHPDVTHQIIPTGTSAYVLTEDAQWLLKAHLHLSPSERARQRRNEWSKGFRIGKKIPAPKVPPTRPEPAVHYLHAMHGEGLTDRQIAERAAISHGWAKKLRRKLGLPPNSTSTERKTA